MRIWLVIAAVAGLWAGSAMAQSPPSEVITEARTLTFDSGFRVVLARTPPRGDPPRVHVASYVGFGSRDEDRPGEAHFIEHVVANSPPAAGTLPATPASATIHQSNAVTRPNHTSYVRSVSPDAVEAVIISRLVRIGRVARDESSVERERTRVLTELERTRLNVGFSAYKALDALTRSAPPDLATEVATVTNLTSAQLWETVDARYGPGTGVLIVAGDIDLDRIEAFVRTAVADLSLDQRSTSPPITGTRRAVPNDNRTAVIAQNEPGVFSAAVAFPQPDHVKDDYAAFMVLDQLLMGGRVVEDGVARPARSDSAPLAIRLHATLGAMAVYDGKDTGWGVPLMAEGDPAVYIVVFNLPSEIAPEIIRARFREALEDIRSNAMSDADIAAAQSALAAFYPLWLATPDGRVLADHLAALPDGMAIDDLNHIDDRLRAVTPDQVRNAMDSLLAVRRAPTIVLTPRPVSPSL